MGGKLSCMPPNDKKPWKRWRLLPKSKSSREARLEEELLQLYQQHMRLERSSSLRYPGSAPPAGTAAGKQKITRSASARGRLANDPVLQPQHLLNKQDAFLNAETKQFVLIHGGGFGAWCWYKVMALLEEAGYVANALDLAGSGIDSMNPNSISCLEIYVKPLITFLEKLPETEKVILVGHDFGGACISYAMERFPEKISKAVFVSATMVPNGQRALDVFAPEVVSPDDLLQKCQTFTYRNGNMQPPTSVEFKKEFMKDLLFNHSPAKDVALAMVSIRPMPFAPVLEKLSLTPECYGSIPRFYIQTMEDQALTLAVQENLLKSNPPDQTFRLKGSDHSPFFSKPQGLFKLLMEISLIKSKRKTQ